MAAPGSGRRAPREAPERTAGRRERAGARARRASILSFALQPRLDRLDDEILHRRRLVLDRGIDETGQLQGDLHALFLQRVEPAGELLPRLPGHLLDGPLGVELDELQVVLHA